MKNKLFLLLLLTVASAVHAQAQDIINYLSAGPNICTPVKVKTSKGTYYVYDEERIVYGNLTNIEAWDCQGRKIIDTDHDRWSSENGTTKRWYVFNTLYPNQNESGTTTTPTRSNSSNYDFNAAARRGAEIYKEGYPNVQLQFGASRMYGEFAHVKACLGGESGFMLYGGIGKDWLYDGPFKDKLLWHAAIGYYYGLGKSADFTIGVSYAQTAQIKDQVMGVDATLSYYFGNTKRFGVFVGGGYNTTLPWGDNMVSESTWDLNVGVAVMLWNE